MTIHELENGNYLVSGSNAEITLDELHKLENLSTDEFIFLFILPRGESKHKNNPFRNRESVVIDFENAL